MNGHNLKNFLTVEHFRKSAKHILSESVCSFINGGSGKELSLKRNINQYNQYLIVPRVLRGISELNITKKILGERASAPILVAPTAYHALLSNRGELDTVAAMNVFNSILILSLFSSVSYKEVAKIATSPLWMQIYFFKDREITKNIIKHVETLGFKALVITVDTPIYAKRNRELAHPVIFPNNISFDHLRSFGIDVGQLLKSGKHFSGLLEDKISWSDIDWVANNTKLPIILKGVLHPEDTRISFKNDRVRAVILSNHGGRQLDSSVSALDVIESHRAEITNDQQVFIDGGISCGQDIFKGLALGADAVLVGRPVLWGLAVGGMNGVLHMLNLLKDELEETMRLSGCASLDDINSGYLIKSN